MKKITLFLLFFVFAVTAAMAQQDCPQVDCPGICGRFVDADGDGFCDHGRLSAQEKPTASAEQPAQAAKTPEPKKAVEAGNEVTAALQEEPVVIPEAEASKEDIIAEDVTGNITEAEDAPSEPAKPFRYPLFTILGVTLGLYLFTFILVKTGKISKPTHRKIWNVTLGITCLGSCLIGLPLAFLINYGYRPTWYVSILHWHVYLGIAMTLIAIFHIFWHVEYFKAAFTSKKYKVKSKK
jgi:hypothetical protein